jgi:hypothetical protein
MGQRLTETELGLQDTVLSLAVLTGIRAVKSLVRAHERSSASLDSVGERPEVELVQGPVVHVGRDSLLHNSVESGIRGVGCEIVSIDFSFRDTKANLLGLR